MPKLLTGKILPPQLQFVLPMLRRNRSKELYTVKKTSPGRKEAVVWELLAGSRHLPASLQGSRLLSSSQNMWWPGTELGETYVLFCIGFRKHYAAYFLLVSKPYFDLRKLSCGAAGASGWRGSPGAAPQRCSA